jgi:hypothetical protein
MVTAVPAAGVVPVLDCAQNVPAAGSRNSCNIDWPAPTVRATAPSQSLPTPSTKDPAAVVVTDPVGAPVAAFVAAVAPTPLAPLYATTVNDCVNAVFTSVEVTVTLLNAPADGAVHTSELPGCPVDRFANDHVSPAPDTVED